MSKEKVIAELFLQMERSKVLGTDDACDEFVESIWDLCFGKGATVDLARGMLAISNSLLAAHGVK